MNDSHETPTSNETGDRNVFFRMSLTRLHLITTHAASLSLEHAACLGSVRIRVEYHHMHTRLDHREPRSVDGKLDPE